jgi:glutathione peroxidase
MLIYRRHLFFAAGLGLLWSASGCFDASYSASRPTVAPAQRLAGVSPVSFFQLEARSLDGEPVSMERFRGKKIIVLNVASRCGYTPQYADWEAFYRRHAERAVVLGFPCNDFMGQEPGTAEEIAQFCQKNYGVTFPMFEKVRVKGEGKSPIYRWLTDPQQNGWNSQEPTWNFCKYLLNEKGELTHFFGPRVKPDSPEFKSAIGW